MKYWLAVSSYLDKKQYLEKNKNHYWCFPTEAQVGNYVFIYCPRSSSVKSQGIYALCKITTQPDAYHTQSVRCKTYKYKGESLKYAHIELVESYKEHLTIKKMKENKFTQNFSIIKRNFQGTLFELTGSEFKAILSMLKKINQPK